MNKKAQGAAILGFLIIGVVVVFLLKITAVPMAHVWNEIHDEFVKPEVFGSDNLTVENIDQVGSFIIPAYDQLIIIALVGIMLTLLVFAVFTDVHPVFIVFLILGLIVTVIITAELANVGDEVANNEYLNNTADSFTFSNALTGTMFPVIVLFIGAAAILIMIKRGGGGGA